MANGGNSSNTAMVERRTRMHRIPVGIVVVALSIVGAGFHWSP